MTDDVRLVDIAKELGVRPQTARARMRRNPALRRLVEIAKHLYPSDMADVVRLYLMTEANSGSIN